MAANLATPLSVQCVRATQSAPRGATSAAATTPDGVLRDCGWILTFELHGIIATERRAVMEALNLVPSKPTSTTVNFCNTSQTPYTFVHAGHTLCISIAAGVDALPVQPPAQLAFRPRGARMFRARLGAGTGVITVEADCVVEQDRAAPMFPLRGGNGERVCSRIGDHFRVTVQLDGRCSARVEVVIRKPPTPQKKKKKNPEAGGDASCGGSGAAFDTPPSKPLDACQSPQKKKPKACGDASCGGNGAAFGTPPSNCSAMQRTPSTPAGFYSLSAAFGGAEGGSAAAAPTPPPQAAEPGGQPLDALHSSHVEEMVELGLDGLRRFTRTQQIAALVSIQQQLEGPDETSDWTPQHRQMLASVIQRLQTNVQLRSLSCPLKPLEACPALMVAQRCLHRAVQVDEQLARLSVSS